MTETIENSPYNLIGGEKAVQSLVDRFYFLMDTLPEAAGLRAIHAPDLAMAREKLFKYLSGWLGGPDLYIREYGHPRLRQRHFPFAVGIAERDQWMLCMDKALQELTMDPELRQSLSQSFFQLATHMINQDPH
jgi:hemoglobin